MSNPKLVNAGFVGVPGPGERICSRCRGAGRTATDGHSPMGGCDRCEGTGVTKIRKAKP